MEKKTIKKILEKFPKLNMSIVPTPILKLDKISNECETNIYCMRDDLTGFAFGGNKTRKLDYLIANALNQNKDTLIGIGANQSNFCRIVTAAGIINGMDVHLVLAGEKPGQPTGNLLIDHLFGAKIHHIDTDDDNVIINEANLLERKLIEQGKKVYNIPFGGSIPTGILGYVEAFDEILTFSRQTNTNFSTIIHASGSGGTQSGLVVGQAISGWPGKIIGMSVGKDEQLLSGIVFDLASETAKLLGVEVERELIKVDDSYVGEAYGAKTEQGEQAIKLFAQKEGILLDNVYTGKAVSGLLDYASRGLFKKSENILFIHTGGNIQLFE